MAEPATAPPDVIDELRRRLIISDSWRSQNSQRTQNDGAWSGEGDPGDSADASRDWESPVPLAEIDRPEFPTAAFPAILRDYVDALALATQTPSALAALLCLAVIAAAGAKRVVVRVRNGWTEAVNAFFVVALGPGNRKTAVFADVVAPLEAYEAEEARRLGPEIAQAQGRYKIAEQALAKAQRDAASAKPSEWAKVAEDADRQARELATTEIPEVPRLIVDDCSPERLASLMARQGGRIAGMSPEGGIFEMMAGRYSQSGAPNLDVFLKGHAGDAIRVDRVGRSPEFVQAPALTLALAVQPDVIRGLAGKPGFRGRGLLARFAYGMPISLVGRRAISPPPIPDSVRAAYSTLVSNILGLVPLIEEDGSSHPRTLLLSKAAVDLHMAFEAELEPRLGDSGDLAHVADWASKLAGLVARLAGLLHTAEHAASGRPWDTPISGTTMAAAIRVGVEFLIPHAIAAFAEMGADPSVEEARVVLHWLEARDVEEITRRDLHQNLRRRFARPDDLDPALRLLVDHGYLRERERPERSESRGRRPSPLYEINPLWRSQNSQRTQKHPGAGNSEDNVNSVNGLPGDCISPGVCGRLGPCHRHAAGRPCRVG